MKRIYAFAGVVASLGLAAGLTAAGRAQPVVLTSDLGPAAVAGPAASCLPGLAPRVQTGLPGASNVIRNSGNGYGNTIIVDNGGTGGTTIISNVRNGIGNRLIIADGGKVVDVPGTPGVPGMSGLPGLVYKGKDNPFWSRKVFNPALNCDVFFDPRTYLWFRYHAASDSYRAVLPGLDTFDDGE